MILTASGGIVTDPTMAEIIIDVTAVDVDRI